MNIYKDIAPKDIIRMQEESMMNEELVEANCPFDKQFHSYSPFSIPSIVNVALKEILKVPDGLAFSFDPAFTKDRLVVSFENIVVFADKLPMDPDSMVCPTVTTSSEVKPMDSLPPAS